MDANFRYQTQGVCARGINIIVNNDVIEKVEFEGGCAGNTKGVASLVRGMSVNEAISRLKGIKCGMKPTSCPDQLARALESIQ